MKLIGKDRSWEYWLDGGVIYVRQDIPGGGRQIVEWNRMVDAPKDKAETNIGLEVKRNKVLEHEITQRDVYSEAAKELEKLAVKIGDYVKSEIDKTVKKVKKKN